MAETSPIMQTTPEPEAGPVLPPFLGHMKHITPNSPFLRTPSAQVQALLQSTQAVNQLAPVVIDSGIYFCV